LTSQETADRITAQQAIIGRRRRSCPNGRFLSLTDLPLSRFPSKVVFMHTAVLPIFLFAVCAAGLGVLLLIIARLFNPQRFNPAKHMPYESGVDPIHDTRRRFDVRFYLVAIAFLVFDVELLFLYPWAVATRPSVDAGVESAEGVEAVSLGIDAAVDGGLVESRGLVFAGVMVFIALLAVGFIYDWRKGVFRWR